MKAATMRFKSFRETGGLALVVIAFSRCSLMGTGDLAGGAASPDATTDALDAGLGADDGVSDRDAGGDRDAATDARVILPNPGIACDLKYCKIDVEACCMGLCTGGPRCAPLNEAGVANCYVAGAAPKCYLQRECDDERDCASKGTALVCCASGGSSACTRLSDCRAIVGHQVYCDPFGPPCPEGASCERSDGSTEPAHCVGL